MPLAPFAPSVVDGGRSMAREKEAQMERTERANWRVAVWLALVTASAAGCYVSVDAKETEAAVTPGETQHRTAHRAQD